MLFAAWLVKSVNVHYSPCYQYFQLVELSTPGNAPMCLYAGSPYLHRFLANLRRDLLNLRFAHRDRGEPVHTIVNVLNSGIRLSINRVPIFILNPPGNAHNQVALPPLIPHHRAGLIVQFVVCYYAKGIRHMSRAE